MKTKLFKIVISLVAITYVFSTIGVSVISHYCGGELEEVALFSKPTTCCGEDESDMEDGCCKNETTHVFFKEDFTFYTLVNSIKAPIHVLFIVRPDFIFTPLKSFIADFLSIDKKVHPPNLVQHDIVECSVIRV